MHPCKHTQSAKYSYIAIYYVHKIWLAIYIAILPIATYAYTCRIPSASKVIVDTTLVDF